MLPSLKHQYGVVEERLFCLLHKCRLIDQLFQIQCQVIIHGLLQNRQLAPKAAIAYFETGNLASARQLFDQILQPGTVLWNVMLKGYTEAGLHKETLRLFSQMKKRDVHSFALKNGLKSNLFVGTALIDMYASKLDAGLAYKIFEDLPERNIVVWTAIIKAYIANGDMRNAFQLFNQLEEHDVILWDIMISAYIELGDMATAKGLFSRMPIRDVKSWNTILLGYAIWADIGACERFFAIMPDRNVFSWNGLIRGYARHGKFSDVLNVFRRMLISTNIKPNDAMLMVVLSSCAKLGALNWGRWIHLYSENNGFRGNVYIGNGLIDMYAKCGCIHSAINVFTIMEKRDVITWNSMINGLAMHGMGLEALELFDHMLEATEEPDGITFVGVLSACVHMGLVERGFECFKSMKQIYSIDPWIEHYGCMMDLLGRAGLLYEAIGFVMEMPMEPDDVIWSAFLGACRAWNHVYLAEVAMSRLVRLVPEDVSNYVVLSNIYGNAGRWKDFGRLHKVLRTMGVGKLPGCSLVEVNMEVVEFCSSDAKHARSKDIYEILESLMDVSRVVIVESELDELCEVNFVKSGREGGHYFHFGIFISLTTISLLLESLIVWQKNSTLYFKSSKILIFTLLGIIVIFIFIIVINFVGAWLSC
ncbi:pentatricopeptide repeat-containing protein At3g29230-like isoform X1 [Dendrobium catenatum]|uniref:pentatricopeptide repeat-containing protein At3g29230-like isoform X1 n=1 Tax=Dendrobium catenatum TaxID=906689 RepID=UPI00109F81BF|nr:pentatricopeptide repeat-containing protein At3g29230-like isoform X1 [Dendrobium catenatum]